MIPFLVWFGIIVVSGIYGAKSYNRDHNSGKKVFDFLSTIQAFVIGALIPAIFLGIFLNGNPIVISR